VLTLGPASRRVGVVTLAVGVEDIERRVGEERARIEAEYREVLKNSVAFEKKIRNRWREKNSRKNARIVELEARVAELERELEASRANIEEEAMADRQTKERKLIALMVNDLGIADTEISVATDKAGALRLRARLSGGELDVRFERGPE
jgi:hypothetical protein